MKPIRARSTTNMLACAFLAVVGLLVGIELGREALRMGRDADRLEQSARAAAAKLEAFSYDASGNVPPERRSEHDDLMMEVRGATYLGATRDNQRKSTLVSVAGFAAALLFGFLAVRELRRPRAA